MVCYANVCFNFIISRLFIIVISMLVCDAFTCVSWCLPILLIFHVNTCKLLVFNSPILVNLMADAFLCFMLPSFCTFCTILSVAASPAGYSNWSYSPSLILIYCVVTFCRLVIATKWPNTSVQVARRMVTDWPTFCSLIHRF